MPIESFVKTFFADWLNWTFFWWLEPCLLCRSTQLRATTSCRSQSATTCDSSYVLQNTTPYWKSTTPVLPCTTMYTSVLLCTTKCYSSTTLYYTALLCSTNYYSSTTLYYKVLLQYYKVLLQYCSMLQSTTQELFMYYEVLLQHYAPGAASFSKVIVKSNSSQRMGQVVVVVVVGSYIYIICLMQDQKCQVCCFGFVDGCVRLQVLSAIVYFHLIFRVASGTKS